ncbi:CbtA family protein [Litoribrevibacter euphylliae]|uniref:CbtA family protein n=1 Tax=Litoribrevibacter euphylliae TaxID=1834034 RepID=A0ABV7HH27_9GAMM
MLFRRIILNALLVGVVASFVFSLLQVYVVNPIIFASETYEVPEEAAPVADHHHGEEAAGHSHSHHHDEEAWAPEDGIERTAYTMSANVFAGIGYAAILLAVMSQLSLQGLTRVSVLKGVAWGLGGFIVFFGAPAIGIPPEIPGIEAAPVEHRQLWWMLAAGAVAVGLLVLAFAPLKFKALGLVAIAIPYLVSAPHPEGPAFSHPDPAAVVALTDLHQQFIVTTSVSNLLFWLVMGVMSAWVLNRWVLTPSVLKGLGQDETANA